MAAVIHKYLLMDFSFPQHSDRVQMLLPNGAKFLSVGVQKYAVYMWMLVDPNGPPVTRVFEIFGTGFTMEHPERYEFLGTVFMEHLVWHIFEAKR